MEQLLLTLSAAHVFVKFVKCKAGDALKNYPDSQCPTLLIYKGGTVLKQFIKFDSFGGAKATVEGAFPAGLPVSPIFLVIVVPRRHGRRARVMWAPPHATSTASFSVLKDMS